MSTVQPTQLRVADRATIWFQSVPSLPQMLATAKMACENPDGLRPEDIQNLAKIVLMHYAAMGVR